MADYEGYKELQVEGPVWDEVTSEQSPEGVSVYRWGKCGRHRVGAGLVC